MDRPPHFRPPRLGPRALSISLVNSFGGNFVWLYIFIHATIIKINYAAALAEWCQLLSAQFWLQLRSDASSY